MKASELIENLQNIILEHGDLPVGYFNEYRVDDVYGLTVVETDNYRLSYRHEITEKYNESQTYIILS